MNSSFEQLPSNVMAALQRGNQIEAIKLLREATGLGLKEARDLIDHHARGTAPTFSVAAAVLGSLPGEVVEAWKKGNKIEAIRLLRAKGGAGLTEAKQAIEAFERQQRGGSAQAPATKAPNAVADMLEVRRRAGRQLSPGEVPPSSANKWLIVIVIVLAALGYWIFIRPGR